MTFICIFWNLTMHFEYISMILHIAVGISNLFLNNISGKKNSGCINYVIKKILDDLLKEIICITEGK
jgi:hypothetical protein